jgi:hypothetical protein
MQISEKVGAWGAEFPDSYWAWLWQSTAEMDQVLAR